MSSTSPPAGVPWRAPENGPPSEATRQLYALGLGPGAADLMTVRARDVLQRVATIFAPVRHAGGRSYALEVVGPLLDAERQRVEVLPFPAPGQGWQHHVDRIVAALALGDAAYLTEGDPLFYSTFIDVMAGLRAAHPRVVVEIVPGVPSPLAASALAGFPLADDDDRVAILPAMHALDTLPAVLQQFDTVVLLKVAGVLDEVLACIEAAGLGDATLHARRVGRPEQSVLIGVAAIRAADPTVTTDYFSLLVVRSMNAAQLMARLPISVGSELPV